MIRTQMKKRNNLLVLFCCILSQGLFAQKDRAIKTGIDSAVYAQEVSHAGNRYFETGNFEMAAKSFFASLAVAERRGYASIAATNYNNLSATYHETENYPQAIVYAEKAITSFQNLGDKKGLADAYNSLANVYYMQERDSLCLHFFTESIKNRLLINDSIGLFKGYKNLGAIYFEIGDAEKGIQYMLQGIRYIGAKSDTKNWFTSYITLSGAYLNSGQSDKAKAYLDSCAALLPLVEDNSKIEDYYYARYQYYAKTGNLKEALTSYERYGNYRDSVINVTRNNQLSELNVKYETEKKQKLIQQQGFAIAKRNTWLLMACLAFVLLVIAVYLFYRNIRYKQAQKRQQDIFLQQEIASRALFEGEQQERIRIARDLHDGVGQMLSLVKMNLSTISLDVPQLQKTQDMVDKTIEEVRNVSHNLIPEALHFGIVPALESLSDEINALGETKMDTDIPEEIRNIVFSKQNELSIYRIVQEVVHNMTKHAQASQIHLSARKAEQSLMITIKDNGRGLEEGAIEKAKGIGWKNINARVHLMDGKMLVQSGHLSGTQIELTLPQNGK
ncbi:hypothetical protein DBR32_01545 [Taibaiella sp. KBW10]|uniref:tetratricopeptide repeat-containing sensor histidine kinase n=1 Tax=Taibaiella sp. KBW10 TaxID=2153357 RepID=UPI000F5A6226|nr:sensor histidine kinase [Taibaiella sp. KBW10]RQO32320.1 hypothetical protein DBR32_01545 [Taibaiella sp. KBW10]